MPDEAALLTDAPADRRPGLERLAVRGAVAVLAVLATALVVYSAYTGAITALLQRSLFYSLVGAAALLIASERTERPAWRILFYLLAAAALVPGPYLYDRYFDIIRSGGIANEADRIVFLLAMATVFALVRVFVGWTLVVLCGLSLLYAYFGDLIPGVYGNPGYSTGRLASHMILRTEGLFSEPMGVAVKYIFLFTLFGILLVRMGAGRVFVQLAYALTGRTPGGPGLAAVVSSTLFSSINGSAVAGVVTTGTFTIPLMKRTGYRPKVAAGIEAAASSAGQIMPPVMGAAAFLMAELTTIPYREIALAALIPALLYVLAVLVAVRLEAGKFGLEPADGADIPSIWGVLASRGYLLLPMVSLVVFLAMGFTAPRAAVMAIGVALVIMPLSPKTRFGPKGLLGVSVDTIRAVAPIVAAIASAGILIGALTLTGLGLKISGLILDLGGDSLFLVLVITMITSFVLGLGLPTSAAYLLLAILVAPALVRFGVPMIAAHMFIFYYGLLSAITPPVALAAYAGASIAGSGPNETAVEAFRLGFVKVIVPFLFVYSPGLLLIGTPAAIVEQVTFAVLGIFAIAAAGVGWLVTRMTAVQRLLLLAAAAAMLFPFSSEDVSLANLAARAAGLALFAGVVLWLRRGGRPSAAAPHAGRAPARTPPLSTSRRGRGA